MSEQSLTDLRKRVVDGDPVTPEEYAAICDNLRRERTAKPEKKTRAKKKSGPKIELPRDLKDLF